MSEARRLSVVKDLLVLPAEASWVEFKENTIDPKILGARMSTLGMI